MALPISSICVVLFPHPLEVDHSAPHTTATAAACWPATGADFLSLPAIVTCTINIAACCTSASMPSSNAQQPQQQELPPNSAAFALLPVTHIGKGMAEKLSP